MELKSVSARRPAVMVLLGLASGCIAHNAPSDRGLAVATPPPPAPLAAPHPASVGQATIAPSGYIPMHAVDVVDTRDGEAVLLVDEKEAVAVPIFIGGSEAMSIRLRLGKRRYERPLTHDLLDALMRELGAQLVKVQVDDLKSNTYLGSIFVRAHARLFELDARPSDAIALALGNRAPIFVACKVIEMTAIPRSSFLDVPEGPESDIQVEGCPPKPSPAGPLKTTRNRI
jgi:bifunctional DNase/RNase